MDCGLLNGQYVFKVALAAFPGSALHLSLELAPLRVPTDDSKHLLYSSPSRRFNREVVIQEFQSWSREAGIEEGIGYSTVNQISRDPIFESTRYKRENHGLRSPGKAV
ncbi:hypothetical protein EXIGLDRAFT_717282 [Exidia glandulosa HHB12029]|uniref:Uncharacterized protein n=1 Tax=Exidia glandulosa HHB12029 TaxID=1314781 RepID=A0A165P676_EXIGL|nr:hypothetical protein EXIGLDRAFT_717282 [Exidia glandulosa HHB12029]